MSSTDQSDEQERKNYEVERIIDRKYCQKGNKPLYLVKWSGYHESQNTWQPVSNLVGSPLVEQMMRKIDKQKEREKNWNSQQNKQDIQNVQQKIKQKFTKPYDPEEDQEYPFFNKQPQSIKKLLSTGNEKKGKRGKGSKSTQKNKKVQKRAKYETRNCLKILQIKPVTSEDAINEQKRFQCVFSSGKTLPLHIARLLAPEAVMKKYQQMLK